MKHKVRAFGQKNKHNLKHNNAFLPTKFHSISPPLAPQKEEEVVIEENQALNTISRGSWSLETWNKGEVFSYGWRRRNKTVRSLATQFLNNPFAQICHVKHKIGNHGFQGLKMF